jgi:hypothetical protein
MTMSETVTAAEPEEDEICSVVGALETGEAGSATSKRPLESHVTGGSDFPSKTTVTLAPGASTPQIGTGTPD